MISQVLALDVGNSRLKWGVSGPSGWIESGAESIAESKRLLEQWEELRDPLQIVGSNVAGNRVAEELAKYWKNRGLAVYWIQTSASCCGVINNYENAGQLGTDRWAALIGAWNKTKRECLVVSAGTAMTLDMLDGRGEFIGGQILPGRKLMITALVSGTQALKDQSGDVKRFPLNTSDAMASGVATALISSIEAAYHQLHTHCGVEPACLVTGGDAEWLIDCLSIEAQMEPMLVLDGLLRIADKEEGLL